MHNESQVDARDVRRLVEPLRDTQRAVSGSRCENPVTEIEWYGSWSGRLHLSWMEPHLLECEACAEWAEQRTVVWECTTLVAEETWTLLEALALPDKLSQIASKFGSSEQAFAERLGQVRKQLSSRLIERATEGLCDHVDLQGWPTRSVSIDRGEQTEQPGTAIIAAAAASHAFRQQVVALNDASYAFDVKEIKLPTGEFETRIEAPIAANRPFAGFDFEFRIAPATQLQHFEQRGFTTSCLGMLRLAHGEADWEALLDRLIPFRRGSSLSWEWKTPGRFTPLPLFLSVWVRK